MEQMTDRIGVCELDQDSHLQVSENPLRQGLESWTVGAVRVGQDLEWQEALEMQGCEGHMSQVQNRGAV